ncbi:hypothetical protein PIB30_053763 [Stylosanthes scabra]|uniref:DUF4216 domain-containing protein n=1 Tax=Stylosanthes scabra TaxID=79078 RepID=A0ABU6TIC5_9FABA|nr:hypothetical protein [Stylosanthes scabra]
MHKDYRIVEVNYARRYNTYDPFIVATNARQVYYMSYLGRDRNNWRVVVKCKPRGMVESHEEQTQEEPFQSHEETPARIVPNTDMPQVLASLAGEVEIINFPTSTPNRQSNNDYNIGTEEDTDDEDQDKSDSGSMMKDGGRGRGTASRGRGRPRKNTGVRINLEAASRPSTSTPTATTTTTATITPPFVAIGGLSAGLPQMVMIPTPSSRVQSSETDGAP